jgi:hypothetical protein
LLVALALLAVLPSAGVAGTLEQELLNHAPQLMKHVREKGYKNVGVLKFRVKKGNAEPSDTVGTLNMTLANRTEMALVLVNDPATDKQIGIIQDASSLAAKLKGANHLNPQGRQVLFNAKYPLAWGSQSVNPDAFVVGKATIGADLKEMQVEMGLIDSQPAAAARDRLVSFTVPVEGDLLSEMGESFLVRGFFTGGKVSQIEPKKAVESAAKVKDNYEPYPLADKADPPVALEIWYGRSKVPFVATGGKAAIRQPQPDEKVTFRIVRKKPGRYGIVLKVNGENTIFQERLADIKCHKWILEPDMDKLEVIGYAVKGKKEALAFSVLPPAESRANEVYYGHDVGTFALTVYTEVPGYTNGEPKNENYLALRGGSYPDTKPATLGALQHVLREDAAGAGTATRGLVVAGERVATGGTRLVPFKAYPTPVLSATIKYY